MKWKMLFHVICESYRLDVVNIIEGIFCTWIVLVAFFTRNIMTGESTITRMRSTRDVISKFLASFISISNVWLSITNKRIKNYFAKKHKRILAPYLASNHLLKSDDIWQNILSHEYQIFGSIVHWIGINIDGSIYTSKPSSVKIAIFRWDCHSLGKFRIPFHQFSFDILGEEFFFLKEMFRRYQLLVRQRVCSDELAIIEGREFAVYEETVR